MFDLIFRISHFQGYIYVNACGYVGETVGHAIYASAFRENDKSEEKKKYFYICVKASIYKRKKVEIDR